MRREPMMMTMVTSFGSVVRVLALRLVVAASFGMVAVWPAAAQGTQVPATVIRVVDGDTVDIQLEDGTTERLRLIGIDTPEVVDPRKPVQCFGREASSHAHELLDGQVVMLEVDASQGQRDIYGRLLAYLWLPDNRNFGEVMIADGFAHEYTYRLPYTYLDSFSAAQDTAMANQVGLWSPATCRGDTTQPAGTLGTAPAPEEPAPALPVAASAPVPDPVDATYAGRFDPLGPDRDCGDFRTHAEGQAFFIAAGGPGTDRHRLDGDHDGIACETLP
jgi:endonuclease YncB( thermonuclease family)